MQRLGFPLGKCQGGFAAAPCRFAQAGASSLRQGAASPRQFVPRESALPTDKLSPSSSNPSYQASCSADQRESGSTFDPEAGMACTTMAHSVCSSLDINLVCKPSNLTCNCRRNMAWNPVAKECQVRNSKYVFSKYV